MNDKFFEAILASPQDHFLRLTYADWLEEQGDPRGELLRTLHEMWQTPITTARYRRLRYRRDHLSKQCDPGWLKPMLRPGFDVIRKRLEELERLDTNRAVFASDSHQYRLNPPLPVKRVKQIEARIGCRLPEQYRLFVTELADGGAGPDYGIQPLEGLMDASVDPEWLFSLARRFRAPTSLAEGREIGYSSPGALPICESGCGARYNLILSGTEKGHVWSTSDNGEWFPALFDQSRLSGDEAAALQAPKEMKLEFLDWYLQWLDEALWKVSSHATPAEELFDLAPETTEISVTGRQLTAIPENLRQVKSLANLNLHGNQLAELPDWIGELTKLEFLGVGYNPLSSLPETIGNLRRLRLLFCGGTKGLEELPDSIGRLTKLEDLRLGFNVLKAVPESIGNLHKLRHLDLSHNQLTTLPATVGALRQLRELTLTWNKLSELPPTLANLRQLEVLDLRDNQFRMLPDCVGQLRALQRLNLGQNAKLDLADACRKLARVKSLGYLSLFMNKLTELPEEIGLLTQLTILDLTYNDLATLPASVARLTNLTELGLDHNAQLTNLRAQVRELLPHLD
jgi:uncharacterized protein (TIGR02996 family)